MNSKTKKIIKISSIISAVAILFGVTLGAYFTVKPKVEKFFSDGNGTMVVTPDQDAKSPIALFAAPSDMETENGQKYYTLTATVNPDYAHNNAVDWSVGWKDSSSAWAQGKTVTDYVTVTPTSDGALTAKLTSKGQAFGEQIIVTVTSRDNPSVSATATVDWYGRIVGTQSFKLQMLANVAATADSNNNITMNLKSNIVNFSNMNFTPVIGTHTAEDTFTYSYRIIWLDAIRVMLEEADLCSGGSRGYEVVTTLAGTSDFGSNPKWSTNDFRLNSSFFDNFTLLGAEDLTDYRELVAEMAQNNEEIFIIRVTAHGAYSDYTTDINVYIDPTTFGVTGLSLSDTVYGF